MREAGCPANAGSGARNRTAVRARTWRRVPGLAMRRPAMQNGAV